MKIVGLASLLAIAFSLVVMAFSPQSFESRSIASPPPVVATFEPQAAPISTETRICLARVCATMPAVGSVVVIPPAQGVIGARISQSSSSFALMKMTRPNQKQRALHLVRASCPQRPSVSRMTILGQSAVLLGCVYTEDGKNLSWTTAVFTLGRQTYLMEVASDATVSQSDAMMNQYFSSPTLSSQPLGNNQFGMVA